MPPDDRILTSRSHAYARLTSSLTQALASRQVEHLRSKRSASSQRDPFPLSTRPLGDHVCVIKFLVESATPPPSKPKLLCRSRSRLMLLVWLDAKQRSGSMLTVSHFRLESPSLASIASQRLTSNHGTISSSSLVKCPQIMFYICLLILMRCALDVSRLFPPSSHRLEYEYGTSTSRLILSYIWVDVAGRYSIVSQMQAFAAAQAAKQRPHLPKSRSWRLHRNPGPAPL